MLAAYIQLVDIGPGEAAITISVNTSAHPQIGGMINLDFNSEGKLLGIEVLPATILPESVLREANRPDQICTISEEHTQNEQH